MKFCALPVYTPLINFVRLGYFRLFWVSLGCFRLVWVILGLPDFGLVWPDFGFRGYVQVWVIQILSNQHRPNYLLPLIHKQLRYVGATMRAETAKRWQTHCLQISPFQRKKPTTPLPGDSNSNRMKPK